MANEKVATEMCVSGKLVINPYVNQKHTCLRYQTRLTWVATSMLPSHQVRRYPHFTLNGNKHTFQQKHLEINSPRMYHGGRDEQ